jgi:MHS family proline/betaine transporter-like MFS transporter
MLIYFGTFLEFFEFVLFATLFPVLSKALSNTFNNNTLATLNYFLFWVGFLARPLGALVLAPIGDLYNRKSILIFSIIGMALTTMLMGCIPIYTSAYIVIGCIVFLRLLQGFFTGVEYASATIYLFEAHQDPMKQKLSVVNMGIMAVLGTAFAYFVAALCQLAFLSTINFWRAIFLLTGFLGLWIGGLRFTRLPSGFCNIKTAFYESHEKEHKGIFFKNFLISFFIIGMSYGPYYYMTTFLNVYGVVLNISDPFYTFLLNAFICLLYCFVIISITKGFKQKLINPGFVPFYFLLFIISLFPLSYLIFNTQNTFLVIFAQLLLIICSQLIVSNVIGLIPNLFPKNIRMRSYTLAQTLSASILGGSAPILCHMIALQFENKSLAAIYPMMISLIAYFCFKRLKI